MNKFNEMQIGSDVEFYALVESFQKRFTPNKSAYYSLNLSDGTTTIDARVWDTNLIEGNDVTSGKVYFFEAHINEYASKPQFVIRLIRSATDEEASIKDFIRMAPLSEDALRDGIKNYIKKINNPILKKLVVRLIEKVSDEYFTYPAAISMHHNFGCGLAYHTYSMLCMADKYIELYPGINADLLYSGVLIHDIGKTKELSGVQSPIYTKEGNLLGHIVIGIQMLAATAFELGFSDSEEVMALEHLIASHHGELEYGSPKEPTTIEAFALHFLDLADSKLAAISPEVINTNKGNSSGPILSIGRRSIYIPNIE